MSQNNNLPDEDLPPLSPRDFRIYNRLAERMEQFHNYFRLTWRQLEDSCNNNDNSSTSISRLSTKQVIMTGLTFCSHLSTHHSIEEQYVFPELAKRMPEFARELALLEQHRQIHHGLVQLEKYLERCLAGDGELSRAEVKRLMDGFGTVLWEHLDDEVRALGAENMRRYWSLSEVERLPM